MKLALFDLDYTLLPLDSDHAWGEFTTRIGWTEGEAFRQKNEAFYAQYKAGTLDIHEYVRFSTAAAIRPQALALIEQHRRAGEAVAIVTATNEFITRPIAHALGVDELIAINLERGPGGWFTGEIAGTPSFREGKITRVGQWLAARGLGWADADATFYSDSINDLPLLEKVQRPVAANPDARLRPIALERGWPVLELFGAQP